MQVESPLLNYFSSWFANNADLLAQCHAAVELTVPSLPTDKPAIYADIDFDEGKLIGRITLWETGECDFEAVYSSTGNWILWENHNFRSAADLEAALRQYFTELRKQPEEGPG